MEDLNDEVDSCCVDSPVLQGAMFITATRPDIRTLTMLITVSGTRSVLTLTSSPKSRRAVRAGPTWRTREGRRARTAGRTTGRTTGRTAETARARRARNLTRRRGTTRTGRTALTGGTADLTSVYMWTLLISDFTSSPLCAQTSPLTSLQTL